MFLTKNQIPQRSTNSAARLEIPLAAKKIGPNDRAAVQTSLKMDENKVETCIKN
jgi:hypothetical protein